MATQTQKWLALWSVWFVCLLCTTDLAGSKLLLSSGITSLSLCDILREITIPEITDIQCSGCPIEAGDYIQFRNNFTYRVCLHIVWEEEWNIRWTYCAYISATSLPIKKLSLVATSPHWSAWALFFFSFLQIVLSQQGGASVELAAGRILPSQHRGHPHYL